MNKFEAVPATRSEEPLLLGMIGPPGGGKTLSALKLAKGIQSVRGGDIIVIDTEGGRSRKYFDEIPFKIVELLEGRSNDFKDAILAQLPANPAAIIVDSMSDEHVNYLEWHDEMVPKMGGNEWAAWAKPAAARKQMINTILKVKVPLIFTFRAREKTKQEGRKVINIGWQPVAPLEIVHTLDLTCILPPRADGVPVWKSDKIGEDFIIKLPRYLKPFIQEGHALDENMGAAFARWAAGGEAPKPTEQTVDQDDVMAWDSKLATAAMMGADALKDEWAKVPRVLQPSLKVKLDDIHKPAAKKADENAGVTA